MAAKNILTEKLTISFDIGYQMFEDIMVTALEGGSNYWYDLQDLTPDFKIFTQKFADADEPLSVQISQFIWLGGEIPVYDRESKDSKVGVLNIKKFVEAFKTIIESVESTDSSGCYALQLGNILSGNYDASDADVIFQITVLGSVVFT